MFGWIAVALVGSAGLGAAWAQEPAFALAHTLRQPQSSSGVVFDANADGLPDVLVSRDTLVYQIRNLGEGGFDDRPAVNAVEVTGWGLVDVDADGDLDPFMAQPDGDLSPDWLLSFGDGTFAREDRGNEGEGEQRLVLFADFDGDGFVDAFHLRGSRGDDHAPSALYPGLPEGRFDPVDVLATAAPAPFWSAPVDLGEGCQGQWGAAPFRGGVVRDLDRDGRPDLILTAYVDDRGPDPDCPLEAVQWAREQAYRGLFVLRNVSEPGQIAFEDVAAEAFDMVPYSNDPAAARVPELAFALPLDFDHDGDLDLLGGGVSLPPPLDTPLLVLLRNDSEPGAMRFVDVTERAGADVAGIIGNGPARRFADAVPLDVDNDGWTDVAIANRPFSKSIDPYGYVHVLLGQPDGSFVGANPADMGLDQRANQLGHADLDLDGRLDLVVFGRFTDGDLTRGDTFVYLNRAVSENHWVQLDVARAGRALPGTRVTVYDAAREQVLGTDELRPDVAVGHRVPVLHFGLGPHERVDVELVPPHTGEVGWVDDLPVDRRHVIDFDDYRVDRRDRPSPPPDDPQGCGCAPAGGGAGALPGIGLAALVGLGIRRRSRAASSARWRPAST